MGLFDKFMFGIVFPLMFCLVGGFFAKSGYVYFQTRRDKKNRCLSQTWGKIINISSMKTGRHRSYFPTYEYVVGNEVINVEIKMGTTYCQYKIGDQVKINYDASSPHYSYIEGYKEDTFASIMSFILGNIAIFCGLFVGYFVWFG